MKRTILLAVALLGLCGTAMAQRHIEFRWRGIYFVGDGSYVFNLNRSPNESGLADSVSGFMPSFSGGFQFRKEAAVGLGFAYLADPTGAFTQLPLYAELRSHFTRDRLTPYAVLQVGYSLPVGASSEPPVTKIDEGGLYLGIEFGGRYAVTRSSDAHNLDDVARVWTEADIPSFTTAALKAAFTARTTRLSPRLTSF